MEGNLNDYRRHGLNVCLCHPWLDLCEGVHVCLRACVCVCVCVCVLCIYMCVCVMVSLDNIYMCVCVCVCACVMMSLDNNARYAVQSSVI